MKRLDVWLGVPALLGLGLAAAVAAEGNFNGLNLTLGSLPRLSNAKTRSISPENFTGEKGKAAMATKEGAAWAAARELGQGWKTSPFVRVNGKSTFTMAEIDGPGSIQHIWMTPAPLTKTRWYVLRFYWDGEAEPSVEVPMADFFACGWGRYAQISSIPICVNPGSAFNSYWQMPFRKKARVTIENLDAETMTIYYQIDYTLTEVPSDAAYFHAQFRREEPLKTKGLYTILDGVEGPGHYVGTYLAWGVHNTGWWGEGEIKFYLDGDKAFPTIAGTGTEDYFCGSYNFYTVGADGKHHYTEFTTPYTGMPQVIRPDGLYDSQQRFGLYRWHLLDPVRFEKDLKVTIQALGWQSGQRYLPSRDDIASTAYWYQAEPHKTFPPFPTKDQLEWH